MRHVSLFSGCGMDTFAANWMGYETTHVCEVDPYCQEILSLRYPDATLVSDVREMDASMLGHVDLLTGGFPCQDVSPAGKGAGIDGSRSNLYVQMMRVMFECRPRVVLIENVSALRSRGMHKLLTHLFNYGYSAWWSCVPAAALGAPHRRDRVWILAFRDDLGVSLPDGKPVKNLEKLPRDGVMDGLSLREVPPMATVKASIAALQTGTTLWPTPDASASNIGKGADTWYQRREMLKAKGINGNGAGVPLGIAVQVGAAYRDGPETNGNGHVELPVGALLPTPDIWPTPTAHPRTHTPRPVHHGAQLANVVAEYEERDPIALPEGELWPTATARDYKDTGDLRCVPDKGLLPRRVFNVENGLWPTPSAQTGSQGPGRSDRRHGGPKIRTAVAERTGRGALNPNWVEWLMNMPIGMTDPDVESPVLLDWQSEYGLPRVSVGTSKRKERLTAIGNSLVWRCAALRIHQAHQLVAGLDPFTSNIFL